MDEALMTAIKRCKIVLQRDYPFFSDLLFFIKLREDNDNCTTAAIDVDGNLIYNSNFIGGLNDAEKKTVLCHETLHAGLLHLARGHSVVQSPEYWDIYNLAADVVANFILAENGFMFTKKMTTIVPDTYHNVVHLKTENGAVIYSVKEVKKKSVENVFHELCKNLPIKHVNICLVGGKGKDGQPTIKRFDQHSFGDSKEKSKATEKEWKQRLVNAISRARQIGKLPAGIDRYVEQILEPKIRWQDVLYRFITNEVPNNYTYRRPHKRSEILDFYMPSYLKENLEVACFIDTSCSISKEEIAEFKSENISIAKAFESVKMVLGYIDVKVHDVLEVSNGNISKIIDFVPKGGGGTDMRNVFPWLDKNMPFAKVVIIFTDGYTPWVEEKDLNGRHVLWIITKNGIDIEGNKNGYHKKPSANIGEFIKLN